MKFFSFMGVVTKISALVISVLLAYIPVRFSVGTYNPLPIGPFTIGLIVATVSQAGLFFSEEAIDSNRKIMILVLLSMLPAFTFISLFTLEGVMILFDRNIFRDVYFFSSIISIIYLVQITRLLRTTIGNPTTDSSRGSEI